MQPESSPETVLDSVYASLADRRRRSIVACLAEVTTPITRETLFERIVERETDQSTDFVPNERVRRIYISVYHVHLPKLEDAGVVATDDESQTVEQGSRFETAQRLLVD